MWNKLRQGTCGYLKTSYLQTFQFLPYASDLRMDYIEKGLRIFYRLPAHPWQNYPLFLFVVGRFENPFLISQEIQVEPFY